MRQFDYITDLMEIALADTPTLHVKGRVVQVVGTIIKAVVPAVKIGEVCVLRNPGEDFELQAEVVGLSRDAALLTPIGDMFGISTATEVIPTGRTHLVPVGPGLLGRVLDGLGRPIDTKTRGPLDTQEFYPVYQDAPDPLTRRVISKPLPLGLRVLDGLLTCGEGQRMGIFAAAGGGKSHPARHAGQGRRRRCHGPCADRRTWPRGPGIHRARTWRGRPAQVGSGRRDL